MAVSMIGPKFYAWDRNGKPLAGGKLYTYQARTNAPKATYQSEDAVVENTNPVILNGEGYANVYLVGSYKMVLKDDKDNEIWSSDPVTASEASEWGNCLSATYLSPTSFSVAGNFVDKYEQNRKVRINNNAAEYAYSLIESSVYAAGVTTITVKDAVITTGISEVCLSIVSENSVPGIKAGTVNLESGASVQDYVDISGLDTVAALKAYDYSGLPENTKVKWDGYYEKGDGGGNKGLLKFGEHTDDGGSIFSVNSNTYIQAIHEDEINLLKYGATESDIDLNTASWLAAASDGNRDLLVPFRSIVGYTLNQTIEIKPNSKLRFEKGARVNGASSLAGLPVIKTKEGSGNDLLPPVIATTNIEIENPYITINGAGSIGIETGAGGHDIKITEPVIRSGDDASDQIGILESNCFNTDVSNPSIVLAGDNAVCRSVRNYKYESDGTTPATGYSVLTNTGNYRGTYKHTGDGSSALQLWSLNKKGDLNTGGASADGIYVGNSAFLTLRTALDTTSVDVRGPFTGLVIDAPHIENPRTFMRTGLSDVKAEVRSAKPQSAGDVFDIGSTGTVIECPNFSGFLTGGAPLMNLVSSSSVGQLVIHPASLSSAVFAELQNANLRFSTIRGKAFQRNFTSQTSYDVKFPFDDNVVITHANSGINFTVNLPVNAPIGVIVTASKTASGSLTLNPDASDRILFGGVTNTVGASVTTSDVGSTITVCKTSQGWVVLGYSGSWM